MGDDRPKFDMVEEEARHRMHELARQTEVEFISYLMSEAGERVRTDGFDVGALRMAQNTIHANGYQTRDHNGETVRTVAFAAPEAVANARQSADEYGTLAGLDESDAPSAFSYAGTEVFMSPNLPDGIALLLHPKALLPNTLAPHERPFLVELPDGVVEIHHAPASNSE